MDLAVMGEQGGFKVGRGGVDHFALRQVVKVIEKDKVAYEAIVDLE